MSSEKTDLLDNKTGANTGSSRERQFESFVLREWFRGRIWIEGGNRV